MLDAAVYRNGPVAGVVCHEHRGEPRVWRSGERRFAATVADLVTTFIETDDRLEALCRFAAGVSHDLGNLLGAVANGVAVLGPPSR